MDFFEEVADAVPDNPIENQFDSTPGGGFADGATEAVEDATEVTGEQAAEWWDNSVIGKQFDSTPGGGFADETVNTATDAAGAGEDIVFGSGDFAGDVLGGIGNFAGGAVRGAGETAGDTYGGALNNLFSNIFSGPQGLLAVGAVVVVLYVVLNSDTGEATADAAGDAVALKSGGAVSG